MFNFRKLSLIIFIFTFLALIVTGVPNSAQASPETQTSTGSLAITVYNVDGTRPANAKVYLFLSDWSGQVPASGSPKTTDSNGFVTYSNIAVGSYHVQIEYTPSGVSPSYNEYWGAMPVTVVAVPSSISTGSQTVTVRNNNGQTSAGKTFTVNDDPNAIITNSPALVCPSTVMAGQLFDVTATLRNGGTGAAQNGGISFSFPEFTLQHVDMNSTGPYETNQGMVQTVFSDGMTVSYFDQGDAIDRGGTQGSAEHLLVESNSTNWAFANQKTMTKAQETENENPKPQ